MAKFKCIKCSASFDDDVRGIVYCPYCFEIQPLPPTLTYEQRESVYQNALQIAERARTVENLEDVAKIFEQLGDYGDSRAEAERCRKKLREMKNDEVYTKALDLLGKESVRNYKEAIALLETIPEWRNASFKLDEARKKLEILIEKRQKQRDKAFKIAMIISAILIVVAIATYLIIEFAVPAIRYSSALNQIEDGEYDKAYATLEDLGNYKNAVEELKKSKYTRAIEYEAQGDILTACKLYGQAVGYGDAEARQIAICKTLTIEEQISLLGKGNTVVLGRYEQNPAQEGKETLEWIIAEKDGDKALLISKYAIEASVFSVKPTTWSKSELRAWLNSDISSGFFGQVFYKNERNSILRNNTVTVYKDLAGEEKVDICEDRVFILSENEASKYFTDNDARCALATEFLKTRNNTSFLPDNGMARYWLRSNTPDGKIMYVNAGGGFSESEHNAIRALRPAIWVSTNQ